MTTHPSELSAVGPRVLRVLFTEHEMADVELALLELKRAGFEVSADVVQTLEGLSTHLQEKTYDIVLADYNLPGWTGMEVLEQLRREGRDIPFILVTGSLGEEAAVECIKRGADNYVVKDHLTRLPLAVSHALEERALRKQQRQAEEALRGSEARYRALFENLPIAVIVEDVSQVKKRFDGLRAAGVSDFTAYLDANPEEVKRCAELVQTIEVNNAAVSLYGARSKEMFSQGLASISVRESYNSMKRTLVAVSQGRTELSGEATGRTFSGRAIYLVYHWSVCPGFESTFARVLVSLIDVTERKRLEEQLRQAQKMEAIGQLAGGVAHDFNNLLGVIIGYSDLLLESLGAEDPARRRVVDIKKAGERGASLTRQLLAFSRKQVLQPRVLNLNAVVADMEKMLRRLIGEDIELCVVLAPDLGQVEADPGQVEQVIMNLVVNAGDAMTEGGTVNIETSNVELDESYAHRYHYFRRPGAYVLLAISDTGEGMDQETREHIFEPFFTTKEKGKGTGLGLATVYGIVKQSAGYVWMESEPGQGTTFRVYLPRVMRKAEAVEKETTATMSLRGTETILLVEDEETVRRVTREFLERSGYTVLEATNGAEAVEIAKGHRGSIHLLLTDVVMPGMSGRQLAEQLAKERRDMKVLYMSGYTENIMARRGILETGLYLLKKPFTRQLLAGKVREVLDAGEEKRP